LRGEEVASDGPHDPLRAFVAAHRGALPARRRGKRFNSGEHAWLAGHGVDRACEELREARGIDVDEKIFTAIRRASGREEFQYGELVALSGDFYETPHALFDERPSPVPWLWKRNDIHGLRNIFEKELRWIEDRTHGQGPTAYPDSNVRMAWSAKSYVELVLRNTDHFGWHNARAYCQHHAAALRLVAGCRGRENEDFRRAVCTNAFADHFLTDAFAAGHIRVPRAEIRTWCERRGLSEKIAGALTKLLHDQDGHVDLQSLHGMDEGDGAPAAGLLVQDSNGTTWSTYCDGQLFLERGANRSPAVERAVGAVAASMFEFLLAWQRGELPQGVYAATRMMPFPHPTEPMLVEKFPASLPDTDLDRLWHGVDWYAKIPFIAGLEREHIRVLFGALPEIMAAFRTNVGRDAADTEVVSRLAPEYIAAYRKIG
jgi:hypothetical protein